MKLRLFSPRLFLRAVRNLDRIANALEDLRDLQFSQAGKLGSHRIPDGPDADPDDDSIISYTNDQDTVAWQEADRANRKKGIPTPLGSIY